MSLYDSYEPFKTLQSPLAIQFSSSPEEDFVLWKKNNPPKTLNSKSILFLPFANSFFTKPSPVFSSNLREELRFIQEIKSE